MFVKTILAISLFFSMPFQGWACPHNFDDTTVETVYIASQTEEGVVISMSLTGEVEKGKKPVKMILVRPEDKVVPKEQTGDLMEAFEKVSERVTELKDRHFGTPKGGPPSFGIGESQVVVIGDATVTVTSYITYEEGLFESLMKEYEFESTHVEAMEAKIKHAMNVKGYQLVVAEADPKSANPDAVIKTDIALEVLVAEAEYENANDQIEMRAKTMGEFFALNMWITRTAGSMLIEGMPFVVFEKALSLADYRKRRADRDPFDGEVYIDEWTEAGISYDVSEKFQDFRTLYIFDEKSHLKGHVPIPELNAEGKDTKAFDADVKKRGGVILFHQQS